MIHDNVSVQDRDLLGRLNTYFDHIDLRLREGQGWLIFNADRSRTRRIAQFIGDRLHEYRPLVSSYLVPWRDFALNAYMVKVELVSPSNPKDLTEADTRQKQEYAIAGRVSQDMYYHMCYSDLFILAGLDPSYSHELGYLDQIINARNDNRRPSILITPHMPHELEAGFETLGGRLGGEAWQRFFGKLYTTSLIAL
jgi:hypothetical protein